MLDKNAKPRSTISILAFNWVFVSVFGLTLCAAGYYLLQDLQEELEAAVVDLVIDNSITTIQQYRILRGYYASNVVGVAKANGLKIGIRHEDDAGMIPLPATMIHDLSELMAEKDLGTKLSIYSGFPFPDRRSRRLNAFQREALDAFEFTDQRRLVQYDGTVGQESVHIAIADEMVAGCIGCHNNHPDTPRNDWKLGDVRGVLEITQPVAAEMAGIRANTNKLLLLILAGVGLLLLLPVMGYVRIAQRGFATLISLVDRTAEHHEIEDSDAAVKEALQHSN